LITRGDLNDELSIFEAENPGHWIKARCKELGLTHAQLAREAGAALTNIHHWSRGHCQPSWPTIKKFMRVLAAHAIKSEPGRAET
jgi:predicted transcriptional regulator